MRNRITDVPMVLCFALCSSEADCSGSSGTPPPQILAIVTTSLPDGAIGATYNQTVEALKATKPVAGNPKKK